ncbi:ABC transporter ATP-binding protein [Lacibacter sediminis]|uniref:ABC transporter ATP-binding protein n=1 Tax=Lacibacter sediminis TaxID=2760713 RepID=A0A7G5XDV5_9BACT|nr:ABC transporter ATP-binding protein [Lacibacter sediminis]QNA43658.1 ABC transporter ATP-binding protein [Lacibacter sediminis]
MKHLSYLNKYFWKYRWRLLLGIIFIFISNYFAVLAPQVTGYIIDKVQAFLTSSTPKGLLRQDDWLVVATVNWIEKMSMSPTGIVAMLAGMLLLFAVLRGFFMFLMRQTIIVMSRHIEFDQKNEVFQHYLQLDANFYKTHETGDLMNRMSEDVSRVRMYTGPAIMYLINLIALISLSVFYMVKKNAELSLYVLAPMPILAITIYFVNNIIHKKSEEVQAKLSDLTTNAQQSYSGIRVIKSFVQEKAMLRFFQTNSEQYRTSATALYKVEAIYFPIMGLIIGISTLLVILVGGLKYMEGQINFGDMAAFIMYLTMLAFPVSAIGWVASTIQRAAASQQRLNEFLLTKTNIPSPVDGVKNKLEGDVEFENVSFVYPHTGIVALKDFNLHIKKGEKVAIIGRTGSGKSTIAQLLLRFYDPSKGTVRIDGKELRHLELQHYRSQVSYIPQEVFLFSDTIANNIAFGTGNNTEEEIKTAAMSASVHRDIQSFPQGYQTMVGERGVTLSGGQKQRISIARALVKDPGLIIMDDCLNAVDARTEKEILTHLATYLQHKTAIVITHRIFSLLQFDRIIVMDNGRIAEQGTHEQLLQQQGLYADLYSRQQLEETPS